MANMAYLDRIEDLLEEDKMKKGLEWESPRFIRYEHHGEMVWAFYRWATRHKEMCLCYSCKNMKPNQKDHCPIAQELFEINVKYNLVTPVFECPEFEEGKPDLSEI